MKLIVAFCSSSSLERVRALIDAHEVHGYTEFPETPGSGLTGRHMGSRAWPGTSSVIMTAVEDAKASELLDALARLARECGPDEGLRAMVLPVETMI